PSSAPPEMRNPRAFLPRGSRSVSTWLSLARRTPIADDEQQSQGQSYRDRGGGEAAQARDAHGSVAEPRRATRPLSRASEKRSGRSRPPEANRLPHPLHVGPERSHPEQVEDAGSGDGRGAQEQRPLQASRPVRHPTDQDGRGNVPHQVKGEDG